MTQLDIAAGCTADGRTRLTRRRAAYPFHIGAPLPAYGAMPMRLMLQSISGGLYGGETLGQRITLDAGAALVLEQPAATVVHGMREGGVARQVLTFDLSAGAVLAYLARPLIFFPEARLEQEIAIRLAPGATLLLRDGFMRHAPSGGTANWHFASRVTVRDAGGRLLAAERMVAERAVVDAGFAGITGRYRAFGKIWLLGSGFGEAAGRVAEMAEDVSGADVMVAASALPRDAGVVVAVAAVDGGGLEAVAGRIAAALLAEFGECKRQNVSEALRAV